MSLRLLAFFPLIFSHFLLPRFTLLASRGNRQQRTLFQRCFTIILARITVTVNYKYKH